MNDQNNIDEDYYGISDKALLTEQLDAAIRALHVLAVMHKADAKWMSNYALDALKEVESLGYQYESFKDQLN